MFEKLFDYPFFEVGIVSYGAIVNLAAVYFDYTVADGVHKLSVLTGHEQTPFEIFKPVV